MHWPIALGGNIWRLVADNAIALTILFIFVSAMVGAFIASRKRDPCLKKFASYPVILVRADGWKAWGFLKVFSKGLTLRFCQATSSSPSKASFVLYEPEMTQILCLLRPADLLDEWQASRRKLQLLRMARPNLLFRIARRIRNVVNTFRDAFAKALNTLLGQVQKTATSRVMKAGGGTLTQVSTAALTVVANAYEPILEQYIGKPVVADLTVPTDPPRTVEVTGYLGEYSDKYLLLVDANLLFRKRAPLASGEAAFLDGKVRLDLDGRLLKVRNDLRVPIRVASIRTGSRNLRFDQQVAPGAEVEIDLADRLAEVAPGSAADGEVLLECQRGCDVLMPRSAAIIRHLTTDESIASVPTVLEEPVA